MTANVNSGSHVGGAISLSRVRWFMVCALSGLEQVRVVCLILEHAPRLVAMLA